MRDRLDPNRDTWMSSAPARAVMSALTAGGGAARFVGGAVRNALVGQQVTDVDIATPLAPGDVMARLKAKGLGVVPTGIDHGTVTAIANSQPYEITTLRRDVSTDGRRAVVAFTTDWAEDAQRRDFTMNALYADADGTIFDPTGGRDDLAAGRVRFIGDATARIREDYLRILRLFRFHAWYGRGEMDATAVAAAAAEKGGIAQLSGERIQKETLKLLAAPDPMPAIHEMGRTGILAEILPPGFRLDWLAHMVAVDRDNNFPADPVLRLAALLPNNLMAIKACADRMRLSNVDRERIQVAVTAVDLLVRPRDARRFIYKLGPGGFRDLLRVRWARGTQTPDWLVLLKLADGWRPPRFPLDGRDAMAAGLPEGPRVGQVLSFLEDWWIDQDFKPDRDELLKRLGELVGRE